MPRRRPMIYASISIMCIHIVTLELHEHTCKSIVVCKSDLIMHINDCA